MLRRRQEAGAGGGATEARTCLLRVVGDRRRCRSVAVATTAAVATTTRVPGTEERGHPSLPRPPVPGERKGKGKAEPRNEVEPTTVEVRKTTVAPLSLSLLRPYLLSLLSLLCLPFCDWTCNAAENFRCRLVDCSFLSLFRFCFLRLCSVPFSCLLAPPPHPLTSVVCRTLFVWSLSPQTFVILLSTTTTK